jgi:type VI secretion system protein ImpL
LVYLATGAALLVYLILSWFLGTWLHLKGSDLWILRGGLAVLGLIAAGSFLWFYHRAKKAAGPSSDGASPAGGDEVDLLVHEAVKRLRSSSLGSGTSLGKLPLIFVLGDSGSVKTSTIVSSGLEPELLAGHAYQDKQVVPTRTANLWYTREAVFADVGGDLSSQASRWARLVRLVRPGRISSSMGKGQQAPRAAIVCFSCENFLQAGASEAASAAARKLGARLQEISSLLSINFPVYVLFTKVDRIPSFAEYAQNLTKDEASEVLGATLPVRSQQSAGVYAEEETKRVTKAFDELFYSLADRRLTLLGRENQSDKLPGIYEFPRELRKVRSLLVQYLVDLARPSQLQSNPFLRGFYFSGVRAVVIDDVAPAAFESMPQASPEGATRIFSAGQVRQQSPMPARSAGSRKVPQWVFLPRLFNDVILKDRVALSASGFSSKVNVFQRVALAAVLALCFIACLGFFISFMGNHALKRDLDEAAAQVPATQLGSGQLASSNDLQRLDGLRQQVAILSQYRAEGAPLHLRWGLYIGDRLYAEARRLYFERFRQMMFGATQNQIVASLRTLPDTPGPNDTYEKGYNGLKAYLITTSNHDHSTQQFLSPVLSSYWSGGREVDLHQAELAKQQFDFYATELAIDNPFSSDNSPRAISNARSYLSKFAGIDRYYLPLISEAGQKNPSVSFSRQFKDAGDVISSRYEVKGAFTKGGFAFMQTALAQPSRYISNEEWVLGKSTSESLDATRLQQQLAERYNKDFANEWRTVLKTSTVLGYNSLQDAGNKLGKLAGPSSPLLELFWFVSHNTDVDQPQIRNAFQPVQSVQPPGPPDKYIQPPNEQYVSALTNLQSAIGLLANSPTGTADTALVTQTLAAGTDGDKAVGQMAQKFRVDTDAHIETVAQNLLQAPILHAEALIKMGPRDALNGSGRPFCSQFAAITQFYPFNPSSTTDLPLSQFAQVFAPGTGALWTFYDTKLKPFLTKDGTHYVPISSGNVNISPAFLSFFNRAAAVTDAFYPAGSPTPRLNFSLRQMPSNLEGLSLKIGNDTLSAPGQAKSFNWTGAEDVQVTTKGGDILASHSGPWAVFHFVADAHIQGTGSVTDLEWILQSNGRTIMLPNGKPKSYDYQLQVSGFNPLRPGELSSLRCVSQVAK